MNFCKKIEIMVYEPSIRFYNHSVCRDNYYNNIGPSFISFNGSNIVSVYFLENSKFVEGKISIIRFYLSSIQLTWMTGKINASESNYERFFSANGSYTIGGATYSKEQELDQYYNALSGINNTIDCLSKKNIEYNGKKISLDKLNIDKLINQARMALNI